MQAGRFLETKTENFPGDVDNAMSTYSSKQITGLLCAWSDERCEAALDALVPLVYDELHRQAHCFLRRERAGHTLQTTALINEAFLKLIDQRNVSWESRTHFFGIAAQLMRRVLLDYARKKHREKRGGGRDDIPLEESVTIQAGKFNLDLLALDDALTRLAKLDEQQARIVELKFFGDLTIEGTAQALGVSTATVKRDWNAARAWLHHELTR